MVVLKEGFFLVKIIIIGATASQEIPWNLGKSNESRYDNILNEEARCKTSILPLILDKIIDVYMTDGYNLLIATGDRGKSDCYRETILSGFLKLGTRTVLATTPNTDKLNISDVVYQHPTGYIILETDSKEMKDQLIQFARMGSAWNPRGLFIELANSKAEAVNMMKKLWENFIYKVVILIIGDGFSDKIEAYTWQPYYPHNYCGPPTLENLIRLGISTEDFNFEKKNNFQPGIMPKTFGDCPLNVTINIWEPYVYPEDKNEAQKGMETSLVQMVFQKMKIKANGTFRPLRVGREPSEAWLGSIIPFEIDLDRHDLTTPYIEDMLVWIVPRRPVITSILLSIGEGFGMKLWAASILSICLIAVSLMAVKKEHWCLSIWGSLWDQVDKKIPKKVRVIWAGWLILILHLVSAYKTVLVARLMNPVPREEIHNQAELVASDLRLGFLSGAESLFNAEDEVEKIILEQYVLCDTVFACYKKVPEGQALMTNKMYADYLAGRDDVDNSIVENVSYFPAGMTYHICTIFVKGHAVVPAFNRIVRNIIEAGFISRWMKNARSVQARINIRKLGLSAKEKLSLVNFQEGFILLVIGLILGGISFFCEIIHHLLSKSVSRLQSKSRTLQNSKHVLIEMKMELFRGKIE